MIESYIIDDRIYCKVKRIPESTVRGYTFDLMNEKYYLLLATGVNINLESVEKHDQEAISYSTVLLTVPENVDIDSSTSPLILVHGSFMIVSWIGLASVGIVLARYFKKSWPNKTICGQDIWFIWHVLCMLLTWVLTIAGFIIIFVYLGRWSQSAHAVMGCIVLALAVIHPIGAVFR